MTSNTINFNATFSFPLNLTVTPVTRGSPSGGPSAANIHLDGQFQFSANIRVDMDGPSVPNPEAWISRWVDPTEPSCVQPISMVCESVKDHRSGVSSYGIAPIVPVVVPVVSISPVSPVSPISPVVPTVPVVPAVPVVPVVPAVIPAVPADCAHRAILPAAMLAPVDTTPVTPTTASTPVTPDIPATPATTTTPYTASIVTANPVTPVAEPSWLKKAMRNDRPFWESPKRSSKRVIPPVRARVHPDSVPEDWVTTYIDNEPRTFYYPMKQY
ncbi:hypothetical protein BASA50_006168 [Batrachochytrium salamandrivorans]|uniref:Uncharacterized protein n=1 Tax=Batrachochytrium salamandrivorans TaxID=1357716 RepID=A0ABQ8FDY9_9FUNG|nr:hypothetical protein BASA50_006168 [Batrachochytrium salamandrivorans]